MPCLPLFLSVFPLKSLFTVIFSLFFREQKKSANEKKEENSRPAQQTLATHTNVVLVAQKKKDSNHAV